MPLTTSATCCRGSTVISSITSAKSPRITGRLGGSGRAAAVAVGGDRAADECSGEASGSPPAREELVGCASAAGVAAAGPSGRTSCRSTTASSCALFRGLTAAGMVTEAASSLVSASMTGEGAKATLARDCCRTLSAAWGVPARDTIIMPLMLGDMLRFRCDGVGRALAGALGAALVRALREVGVAPREMEIELQGVAGGTAPGAPGLFDSLTVWCSSKAGSDTSALWRIASSVAGCTAASALRTRPLCCVGERRPVAARRALATPGAPSRSCRGLVRVPVAWPN